MKRIGWMCIAGLALALVLAAPASAAREPIPASGDFNFTELHDFQLIPVGGKPGQDDHHCFVLIDGVNTLDGTLEGQMPIQLKILQRGPCSGGAGSVDAIQHGSGTFTGAVEWDGTWHEGSCELEWRASWEFPPPEHKGTAVYWGRFVIHSCSGEVTGLHGILDTSPAGYTGELYLDARR
jgi:hypothetical protein